MLEKLNPRALATPETYTHVIIAVGTTMVFIAGQVAEDANGQLVGDGDIEAQAHQAFHNLGIALDAAGARPNQVARISIYVVNLTDALLEPIENARAAVFGDHKPTDVLLGVAALAHPGCLIEVDATAVI